MFSPQTLQQLANCFIPAQTGVDKQVQTGAQLVGCPLLSGYRRHSLPTTQIHGGFASLKCGTPGKGARMVKQNHSTWPARLQGIEAFWKHSKPESAPQWYPTLLHPLNSIPQRRTAPWLKFLGGQCFLGSNGGHAASQ